MFQHLKDQQEWPDTWPEPQHAEGEEYRMTYKELYEDFNQRADRDYETWKDDPGVDPHEGVRYRQMLNKLGGVESAKRLIAKLNWKPTKCGIEYFAAHPKYKQLFTPHERQIAMLRLQLTPWYRDGFRYDFRTGKWYQAPKSKLKIIKIKAA
jgi:hypothetical protein